MKCPFCGEELPDEAKFCSKCGRSIKPEKKRKIPAQYLAMLAVIVGLIAIITVVLIKGKILDFTTSSVTESSAISQDNEASKTPDSNGGISSSTASTQEGQRPITVTATPSPTVTKEQNLAIDANVTETMPSDLSSCIQVSVTSAVSSSHLVQSDPSYNNEAKMAVDGDPITSWQEGVTGDGVGEQIQLTYSAAKIKYIDLKMGNWRRTDLYEKNDRPKSITIVLGGKSFGLNFPDQQTDHYIAFTSPISAADLTMTIDAVYTAVNADCCISEITLYATEYI